MLVKGPYYRISHNVNVVLFKFIVEVEMKHFNANTGSGLCNIICTPIGGRPFSQHKQSPLF